MSDIAPAARPARSTLHQLILFGIIGAAGFVVDTAALMFATKVVGLDLYSGRVFSYLCAATFTWICNRRFTFTQADPRAPIVQWLRFLGGNAIGGVANYGVYALIITFTAIGAEWPVLGVAAGSLAGLVFNFAVNKYWVFRA